MTTDKTTATGLARSLIRSVTKLSDPETSLFYPIVEAFAAEYTGSGGLAAGELVGRSLSFRDRLSSAGPFPTSCEIVRTATKRRAVLESVRPGVVKGTEQAWMVSAGSVFNVTKDVLSIVEVNPPIAVSQHALMRLYERSDFSDEKFQALLDKVILWVVPLLRVLSSSRAELGTEIAIPFAGGLLLGTLEATVLSDDQGPSLTTVSRKGSSRDYLTPVFGRAGLGILQISINTFVHDDELHANQSKLMDEFENFSAAFAEEMAGLRTGMLRGLPDERVFSLFGGTFEIGGIADLERLQKTLTQHLSSQDWKMHAEAHRRPSRFLN